MDLICFVPTDKYFDQVTSKICDGLSKDDHFETYKTLGSFLERIHRPKKISTIIIFCAENRRDIKNMLSYKKLLNNTRIIMVLPDRTKETTDTALLFYPRFYIYAEQDFKLISVVVDKMCQNFSAKKTQAINQLLKGGRKKIINLKQGN